MSTYIGFDELIDSLLKQVGNLKEVYVVGDYARGVDSGTIDLILVGQLNDKLVEKLLHRVSKRIKRTFRYQIHDTNYEVIQQHQLKLI